MKNKADKEYVELLLKGELHIHLNGLVSPNIVKQIAQMECVEIPVGFDLYSDLTQTKPSLSLQEYLKPWELLRLIPNNRTNLKKIVDNAFHNLKAANVQFAEIRNSVLYIAIINGVSVECAMNWLIEDIEEYSEKYNIKSGLILTTPRGDYSTDHLRALIKAYENLDKPRLVVGLDLAGNEDAPVPPDLGKQFFHFKELHGLKITIHAGETGKKENIIKAIEEYGADRIGHGTAAAFCGETMQILKEKDICVEVCPISNRLTNAVREEDSHPVCKFIENQVPFVLCSDNPSIHMSSLSDDYISFLNETNCISTIEKMYEQQRRYTFLEGIL